MRDLALVFVIASLAAVVPGQNKDVSACFDSGSLKVGEVEYPFRLMRPLAEVARGPQPLVVYLHGAGERGTENERQLTWLPSVLGQPDKRKQWPCYLLAVQCPKDERWVEVDWGAKESTPSAGEASRALHAVHFAMQEVIERENVDRGRVYLTGLSMGGYGAWDLGASDPSRFAALLPVCGGGDERTAARLHGLPIQVWHGDADRAVPVERSRSMVAALRATGAEVAYHELPGVGHDSWRQAYGDGGGLAWMFAQDQRTQQRGAWATFAVVPTPHEVEVESGRFEVGMTGRVVVGDGCEAAGGLFASGAVRLLGWNLGSSAGVARRGDFAFSLDPKLEPVIEVTIDRSVQVRVREAKALPRAAAVALQAMMTRGDGTCPKGRFVVRELPQGYGLVVAPDAAPWTPAQVLTLLRRAWLCGVDRVAGPGFDRLDEGFDEKSRQEVRALAAAAGIALEALPADLTGERVLLRLDGDLDPASVLSLSCRAGANRLVVCGPHSPEQQLMRLAGALPYVAEGIAHPKDAASVRALRSRVGCWQQGR